jgi:hypothetical protein
MLNMSWEADFLGMEALAALATVGLAVSAGLALRASLLALRALWALPRRRMAAD